MRPPYVHILQRPDNLVPSEFTHLKRALGEHRAEVGGQSDVIAPVEP